MFWGLSNEILIGGICQELVDNHHDLQKLVRELDPTHLTTIAHSLQHPVDGPVHHITDVRAHNLLRLVRRQDGAERPRLDKFHAETRHLHRHRVRHRGHHQLAQQRSPVDY